MKIIIERIGTVKIHLLDFDDFTQTAKNHTPNNIGKSRITTPLSIKLKPWINKLINIIIKTEIIPMPEPKNPPAIGAKKSNKVKLAFEPTTCVKGI